MISKNSMIRYLQSMMDDYMKCNERYGEDDDWTIKKLENMIACKEMVESLIGEPVNLQENGTVTTGF